MGTIRIAAFHGGGIRGILNLPSVIELENAVGPLSEHFHFIAGTSTGALQATGLSQVNGSPLLSAEQILDIYMNRGGDVFDNSLKTAFKLAFNKILDQTADFSKTHSGKILNLGLHKRIKSAVEESVDLVIPHQKTKVDNLKRNAAKKTIGKALDYAFTHSEAIFSPALRDEFEKATDGETLSSSALEIVTDRVMRVGGLFRPKYNPDPLEQLVTEVTGEHKLSDVDSNLILTTYDIEKRKACQFKSWRARNADYAVFDPGLAPEDYDAYLKDILMGSTAAPTYFPPHLITNMAGETSPHIDGGMWANNPSAIALASARSIFGDHHNFLVVSFGTGETKHPYSHEETRHWGKLKWGAHAVEIFRDGQMQAVDRQMKYENNAAYLQFQTNMDQRDGDPRVDDVLDAASPANRQALLIRGERMKEEHQHKLDTMKYYMNQAPLQNFDELLAESKEKNENYRPEKDDVIDYMRELAAKQTEKAEVKKTDQPEITP